jgi:hypothetical protein
MRIASLATAVVLAFSANVYASYMDNLRARCEAYGSTPGTRDFYQCLHDVTMQEQRLQAQKALEPKLAGCGSLRQEVVMGSRNAAWDSDSVVTQLSPVALSGCSAQVQ